MTPAESSRKRGAVLMIHVLTRLKGLRLLTFRGLLLSILLLANLVQAGEIDKKIVLKGRYEAETIWRKGFTVEDKEISAKLQEVLDRLVADTEVDPAIDLKAHIFRSPEVNAFALPDGSLFIFPGLLARLNSIDEVAFILGHEAQHAIGWHAQKYIGQAKTKSAIFQTLSLATTIALGTSDIAGAGLINSLSQLGLSMTASCSVNGYGRGLEREADLAGIASVRNAGYRPCGTIDCFNVLLDEHDDPSRFENVFWGSHPLVRERIESAKEVLGENCVSDSIVQEDYAPIKWSMTKLTAELWVTAREPKEAIRSAESYVSKFPEDPEIHKCLGDIYGFSCDPDTLQLAQEAYLCALKMGSDDYREPLLGLSDLAEKQGDTTSCMGYLKRYLAGEARVPKRRSLSRKLEHLKQIYTPSAVDSLTVIIPFNGSLPSTDTNDAVKPDSASEYRHGKEE